ncbi:MAG: nuclear transport factor 2 family protein [Candidatus Limnocylindria bacterium]
MAHPNEELLRRGKEAFLRGEVETAKELLADDFVVHTAGRGPFAREYRGRDAFFGFIAKVRELSGGTYRQELHDVAATDEHAIAIVIVRAERNGKSVEYRSAEVYHVRDGKATEAWFLNDSPDDEFWS